MFSTKFVSAILIFFIFFSTSAQNPVLDEIDIPSLKKHLNIIASDSLMGRQIGAENNGLEMAADYIINSINKIGLSPVNGSFIQPLSIYQTQADEQNSFLQIFNENEESILKTDSIVSLAGYSEIDIENAEIVFAGFGLDDEMKVGSNNIDFKGKMVLLLLGDENSYKQKKIVWNDRLENNKINSALEYGALGVVFVVPSFDHKNKLFSQVKQRMNQQRFTLRKPEKQQNSNNTILIPASVANVILGGIGKIEGHIENNEIDFTVGTNVSIQGKRENREFPTKNIMGIVEGSDPKLKDECVIVMAHYDHLGVDESGDYYNGADDNGSGVVTLLEVADAMVKTPQKPKRSVLFLWITSEEIGLFGSQYYASNPAIPLEKTVTCINIDMDGRVWEPRDSVWNDSPKKVKDFDGLYTLTNETWPGLKDINTQKCKELDLVPDYSLPERFLRSSDHYYFHNSGVPILNFATGYHYDYHKPTDEISRISFEKIKRVADLCYLVSYEVANLDVIEF